MTWNSSRVRELDQSLWRATTTPELVEHTAGSLLAERARSLDKQLAITGNRHGSGSLCTLTYAELHDEATQVATALLTVASPGESVALWAPNVLEWPIVQYGTALAGMTLVALNPALSQRDLQYALRHSRAALLIHADRNRDRDLAGTVTAVHAECPDLRAVVSLSCWNEWISSCTGEIVLPESDPAAPAMLQYTSGTTSSPKGVLLAHRSLINVARFTVESADVEPGACSINPLPMFHTAACVVGTLGPLWLGGHVVLVERFQPEEALELIRRENASVLFFVPTVLSALVDAARAASRPAPVLRTVMGGAATLPSSVVRGAQEVFGASVHNMFGQTELAPVLSLTRRDDSPGDIESTVGRPLPRVDCKVVDPVTGEVQPLGRPGEICARGYQQMLCYLHDEAETARTVDPDGWVHTGDLGSMDQRGVLTLAGRLKELIIRGGENIAPAEVESCLAEHESVLEVAVFGIPDGRLGEVVGAAVRPREGTGPGLQSRLEAHCRHRLVPFKVPQRWFRADALPTTPTGKVRKFELLEQVREAQVAELD